MSRVVDAIRAFPGLSGPGVVAVSGGADSVALLRGLLDAGAGPLTVAHFNHQLRGAESDADEAFVRELASGLGLPFRLGEADVRAAAAGDNLEATARRLRYDWLAGLGGEWVATGHTADDQAETVLHRIIRGTGIRGLRGVARSRPLAPGVFLRRPLLTVSRADVLAYLADLGQSYREDATNADPTFTRNRIRRELLPLLQTFNPKVVEALGRLAEHASGLDMFLYREAVTVLDRVERPRAGNLVVLDVEGLGDTDHWVVRELFRRVWDREGWPTGRMAGHHWAVVHAIALGVLPAADFPGGVIVRRAGRVVQLGRRS